MTIPAGPSDQPLTAREVFAKLLRIPQRGTRALVPLVFHAEQARFLEAYDARDEHGAPLFDELAALWIKKSGKSETGGGLAIAELVAGTDPDREVIIVASDLQQGQNLTFASACRFVRRNAWLAKHLRILKSEIVYAQTVTDGRTGGRYGQDHIIRAVPARDYKSLEGTRATLTIFDEFHAINYETVSALAPAPTRPHPRLVYFSYAGLRVDAHEGAPLWDVWQRWQRGDDPRLFVSYIGGPDGWTQIPWITERFIQQQKKQFSTVPAKYKRLWENTWATGDAGSFLTSEEIREAIDPALTDAAGPVAGASIGVDLGLTFDTTAIVVSHVDGLQRLTVDAVRILRGSKGKPVSLMVVEDLIVELATRVQTRHVTMDRWQAALLGERLRARNLSVKLVDSNPVNLDKWATQLKRWFSTRAIRLPQHPGLIEQLEGLEGEELRRRDRVRFTATGENHDDAAIALVLSGQADAGRIGHVRMAEIDRCQLYDDATSMHLGAILDCYLGGGNYLPPRLQRVCQECPAHVSTVAAREAYAARSGETYIDVREFVRRGLIEPNRFFLAHRADQALRNL